MSENTELLTAIGIVESHIGNRGIHAIDRGGDRGVICRHYLSKDTPGRFVIRDRIHKGNVSTVWIWLRHCLCLMRVC